jgi:hypothetical protein
MNTHRDRFRASGHEAKGGNEKCTLPTAERRPCVVQWRSPDAESSAPPPSNSNRKEKRRWH